MKKAIRTMTYSVLLGVLIIISGCWDSKEVENLAITTLIACDKITENGVDQWQVSARILDMSGAGSGESSKKASGSEILIKGTGLTFQEAIQDLTKRLPSRIFYEHNAAIIIGERVAKEELPNLIGNVLRFPGTRLRTYILISRGEAFQALQTKPELVPLLSKELKMIVDRTAEQTGSSAKVTVLDFAKQLSRTDRDPVLPAIKIHSAEEGEKTGSPSIVIEGLGIIRKSKLIGWLNQDETMGYLFLTDKSSTSQISISTEYDNTLYSYFLSSYESHIESELIGDTPSFTIKLHTEGAIHEINKPVLELEEIPALEKAASQRIQEIALETISKSKEYDADFLGLNTHLHRHHPEEWAKIASDWREHFPNADIKVEVEAKVTNFGTATRKFDLPQ